MDSALPSPDEQAVWLSQHSTGSLRIVSNGGITLVGAGICSASLRAVESTEPQDLIARFEALNVCALRNAVASTAASVWPVNGGVYLIQNQQTRPEECFDYVAHTAGKLDVGSELNQAGRFQLYVTQIDTDRNLTRVQIKCLNTERWVAVDSSDRYKRLALVADLAQATAFKLVPAGPKGIFFLKHKKWVGYYDADHVLYCNFDKHKRVPFALHLISQDRYKQQRRCCMHCLLGCVLDWIWMHLMY